MQLLPFSFWSIYHKEKKIRGREKAEVCEAEEKSREEELSDIKQFFKFSAS
jgi:hypothetical protein